MQNKDKIKDIFSSKLKSFEPEVPDFVWEKIDKSLSSATVTKPIRKTIIRRLSLASGIAAAIILSALFLLRNEDTVKEFSSAIPEINSLPIDKFQKDIASESKVAETLNQATISKIYAAVPSVSPISKEGIKKTDEPEKENTEEKENQNTATETSPNEEKAKRSISKDNPELKRKIAQLEELSNNSQNIFVEQTKNTGNKGMAISFGGRSGLASSEEVAPQLRVSSPDPFESNIVPHEDDPVYDKDKINIDHKQPISFGITVSKNINNRLSVESGIVYTYLSSKINSDRTTNGITKKGEQYFHYLGVPLSLNYNFARWGKAKFYVSLGGMIQKDFYGKLDYEQTDQDLMNLEQSVKHKISQKHVQFSAMSSVGVSFPIYNKLNVYSTVGAAHYFDADNEYRTIFSDRKTQLDLNVGLRFEF